MVETVTNEAGRQGEYVWNGQWIMLTPTSILPSIYNTMHGEDKSEEKTTTTHTV